MSRLTLWGAATLLVAAAGAEGQMAAWGGPVSGILFDLPSQAVRPVVGFRGASYLGAAIVDNLQLAAVSPDGASALAMQDDRVVLIRGLNGDNPRINTVEDAIGFDQASWARSSSFAVTHTAAAGRFQSIAIDDVVTVTDLPFDAERIKGSVTSFAVGEDPSRVLIGVRDVETAGFYAIGHGTTTPLVPVANPGPCAFSRPADAFYCVAESAGQVIRISEQSGTEWYQLDGDAGPSVGTSAIAVSRDGASLYIAGTTDRVVRVYDLASRSIRSEVTLPIVPDRLDEITPRVFLLKSRRTTDQPLWFLDARQSPSAYFVPAGE